MAVNYPDLVGLVKVTGTSTVSAVTAGGSKDATITLDSNYFIIGTPNVDTATTDCSVILINGGKNSFDVRASNTGGADADVVVSYTVYVIEKK